MGSNGIFYLFCFFFLDFAFYRRFAFCRWRVGGLLTFAFCRTNFAFCSWAGLGVGWVLTFAFCSWVANGTDVLVVQPGYRLFPIIDSEQVPKVLFFVIYLHRKMKK